MDITGYRLSSMEEPTDEMLHELMSQVAESARESSANAKLALQRMLQETFEEMKRLRDSGSQVK